MGIFRSDEDKPQDGPASPGVRVVPLLPLRDIVVFPHMVAPLFVGRPKSVSALSEAMNRDKRVFLATQKKAGIDNPTEADISRLGTVGKVLQLLRLPDGTVKVLVEEGMRVEEGQVLARLDDSDTRRRLQASRRRLR